MGEILAISPNRWPGALTSRRYAVCHTTEGTSSLGWLRDPASQVSATILIPRDGPDWWRLGADDDAMWHAGIVASPVEPLYDGVNPNLEAPGIELEGFAALPITDFQLQTCVAQLERWAVPPVPHSRLATTGPYYRSDCGAANFAAICAALNAGGDVAGITGDQAKDLIREMLRSQEGADLVELAIRRPGGYASKLQKWLDANGIARLPKTVAHNRGRATGLESPFTPVAEQQHPTGQKGEWDPTLGPEPVAPERSGGKEKHHG